MNELQIFRNEEFGEIRTYTNADETWFVGKDVAVALGYSNTQKAILNHVDEEDKGVTKQDTNGGKQNMIIINESGLYSLIFSSQLSKAKEFKHWVTKEVIPTIRKQRFYSGELYQLEDIAKYCGVTMEHMLYVMIDRCMIKKRNDKWYCTELYGELQVAMTWVNVNNKGLTYKETATYWTKRARDIIKNYVDGRMIDELLED